MSTIDSPSSNELSELVRPPRGRGSQFIETFRENKLAVAGVIALAFIAIFCFLGPLVYHTNQIGTNLGNSNLGPGSGRPLGTDNVGYDELGRLMVGGQSSIEIGFSAALIAGVFGVLWGSVSGYYGGLVDTIMMRIVDALLSVPSLLALLLLAALIHINQFNLTIAVAFFAWLVPARLIRAETLSLREREYVQVVKAMGGGAPRAIFAHIIPNAIGTIVVNITFQVADAILALAALGYLGFGLPPPSANWGAMLSQGVGYVYAGEWWLIYPVGGLIILTVLSLNLIGDALRDAFDVRLLRR